ncbi:MAG TPA: Mu transposase C-terminal domain-containing protein [Bacteroidales bacterium]|nr:Mu transposase C-terminal domain-containing protein [Bacteroidales bacterium]HSA43570.1 Mu transposase C-terminal domain-containing protein [Bacteroidales bacterium]
MEYFNNTMCITGTELIEKVGIPKGTYDALKKRNKLKVLRRACNSTPALIEYRSMPTRYKEMVVSALGDPYDVVHRNKVAEAIIHDAKAEEFFSTYRLANGSTLPEATIREYCTNAEVMTTVLSMIRTIKGHRSNQSGSFKGIWEGASRAVNDLDKQLYQHSLPTTATRLKDKCRQFQKEGYESIIHRGFCNKNTEKLSNEAQIWLFTRWCSKTERATSEAHLFQLYNQQADMNGWSRLKSVQTIHNYLYQDDIKHLWWAKRYGELPAKEKFAYQHSTRMPTMRDSLWYSDGTKLNYFYLGEDKEGKPKERTMKVYEVMDAYSEVFLGYHISETEDFRDQFHAYKMAVQTAGCRPYQVSFDNQGGHKKLEAGEFFKKIARLAIRTQPYNGKSKTIESAFGRFQQQYMKQDWFFTGQNITAKDKESRADTAFQHANKSALPSREEMIKAYLDRRQQWNNAPHPKTGIPRIQMYRESENTATVKVNMWDMVDLFWVLRPEPVTVTAYGITFRENKEKYTFMVYNENRRPDQMLLRQLIDKKVWIRFDPDDMSLIYLYEKDASGLRFLTMAETKVEIHRGKQEQDPFDHEFLADVRRDFKVVQQTVDDTMDAWLEREGRLPEQNGLVSVALPGTKSKSGARKHVDVAGIEKEISNVVPVLVEAGTKQEDDDEYDIYALM